MLWVQSTLCFCSWIGYGVWLARSNAVKRVKASKARNLALGPILLLLGMVVLTGSLYLVAINRGLGDNGLKPWALGVVLLTGLVFVHCQSVGALLILKSAIGPETRSKSQTSVRTEDSQ